MSYDGWIEYNGSEFINLSRTAQLSEVMGIPSLWTTPDDVQWIEDDLAGLNYGDITSAPWYDAGYPASTEFAGLVPLSFSGLDDSTLTSSVVEYTGDGGHSGIPRNATLPIVANVAIVASTDRGAEYGKRWMDRRLKDSGTKVFCSGADLRYFRYAEEGAPKAHRRDVRLTRGTSVTRKRRDDCSATWFVTFTMTAADPYEYGEEMPRLVSLGGTAAAPVGAPALVSSGNIVLTQLSCPQFDYTPVYDPLFPALVAPPAIPDFYPDGWSIVDGDTFQRFWAKVVPVEPSDLFVVPIITLTTSVVSRMVRISIWPSDSTTADQCDPLFSAVVSYLPAGQQFIIDGEQKASYLWDGVSPSVRRCDSLVYAPDANPIDWTAFNDPSNLMVTLDVFADSSGYEGNGFIRAAVNFVPKSD